MNTSQQDRIRQALDARLSALTPTPGRAHKVLAAIQNKEQPMKKKVSFAMVLVLALALVGAALAAGFNVFGLFADDASKGTRLQKLGEVSQYVGETTSLPATSAPTGKEETDYDRLINHQFSRSLEFTLEQAYTTDQSLYLSYTLRGANPQVQYGTGVPTGGFAWVDYPGLRIQENMSFADTTLDQRVGEWMDKHADAHVVIDHAGLGDGAELADGTPLDIVDSNRIQVDDDTVQGYMECRIPLGKAKATTLPIKLTLLYSTSVYHQNAEGYQWAHVARPDNRGIEYIQFNIEKSGKTTSATGHLDHQDTQAQDRYIAHARLFLSPVDIRSTVTLHASPQWTEAWRAALANMNAAPKVDRIYNYVLQAGGTLYPNLDGGVQLKDNGDIVIDVRFDRANNLKDMQLVPEYREGIKVEEALAIISRQTE